MAKYIYEKWNAVYTQPVYDMRWATQGNIHGWSNICAYGSLVGNKFTTDGCGGSIDASKDGHPVGSTFYKIDGSTIYRFIKRHTSNNGYEAFYGTVYTATAGYYSKGTTSHGNVEAEDGTYPVNGRHTDGYWYVRGGLAFPELKIKIYTSIKPSEKGWATIDGQLREIDKIWTKIDGVLKEV